MLTYRWIDELQDAAYKTLGSIAGRAIGYLAPEVALGGAIVSAGLIETDALDRDGVAAYLSELAENNPELMDHVSSGGGGLLDGLQMRSLLTAGVLAGEPGRAGRRAAACARSALEPLPTDFGSALRDVAGGVRRRRPAGRASARGRRRDRAPQLEELMATLAPPPQQRRRPHGSRRAATSPTCPAPTATAGRLRLVGGDHRRTPARWCARSRRPSARRARRPRDAGRLAPRAA